MPIFKNVTENSSGNVGIGTTSPTYRVSTQGTGDHRIYHYNSGTTTSDNAIIQAEVAGDNSGNAFFCAGKTGLVWSLGRNTSTGNFEIRSNFNLANDASSRMIIKTDGSVGIGTTNPGSTLDVLGGATVRGSNGSGVIGVGSAAGRGQYQYIAFAGQTGGTDYGWQIGRSPNTGGVINDGFYVYDIRTNNTPFAIALGGNVGIGTTSPGAKLDVLGDNNQLYLTTTGTYTSLYTFHSGTNTGALYWNSSGILTIEGRTATGQIIFGTGGTSQERMRINASGNIGIGTTNPQSILDVRGISLFGDLGNSGAYNSNAAVHVRKTKPHIIVESIGTNTCAIAGQGATWGLVFAVENGGMEWRTGCTWNGDFTATGTQRMTLSSGGNLTVSGTITESSSMKIKKNINPITDALALVNNLNGYTYDRIDNDSTNQAGLIAEEVAQVLPGVVSLDQDGNPSGVQYTKIIAYLVESIKELKSELDELKRQ